LTALIMVALAVAVDSFAVALAFGLAGTRQRRRLEIAVVFGLFQGGMPLLGVELGAQLSHALGSATRPAGAALLCLTGVYGLVSELLPRRKSGPNTDASQPSRPGRPWRLRLWIAAGAVSVDNLVAGLALGTYHVSAVTALATFAVAGTGLALLGVELGHRASGLLARLSSGRMRRFGDLGEVLAGSTLIAVGLALGLR
jgi:manganese efflux pump family protein